MIKQIYKGHQSRLILELEHRQIIIDKSLGKLSDNGLKKAERIFKEMKEDGTIIHLFNSTDDFLEYSRQYLILSI